jgi:sec-independent protein translocase protein TatA
MMETTLAINFGGQELLIILLIVVLLFGASRLPQLAKALGQSKRAFREGMDEADEDARLDAKRRESLRPADGEARRDDLTSDKFTADKPR